MTWWRTASDRLLGSDPGLNRLRSALHTVVTIAAILVVEHAFVRGTHAMLLPTPDGPTPPAVAAANHQLLVIGIMVGSIVGMMSTFGVMDTTPRGQLVSMLLLPVPMVASLALGLALGGHRLAGLVSLVVMLALGTYCRRFGARGFIGGAMLFMGDFLGFFLHKALGLHDLGWLCAEIAVGLGVAMVVRFTVFYPRPAQALARTQRSYAARARKVARLALELCDTPQPTGRQSRRLHSQLVRLNEAALMIDAQLGDPAAVAEGSSAARLHQRLFDVELALTNIARFCEVLGRLDLAPGHRERARLALGAIITRDLDGARRHATALMASAGQSGAERGAVVVAHRFGGCVVSLADAMADWEQLGRSLDGESVPFQPAVGLFGGWLPGSAVVSATASTEPGHRRGEGRAIAPYTRVAIQMGVAVGAAMALGDLRSGARFYWAVIAAFITFMGANTAGEQLRKAGHRVAGTLVGVLAGSLLAHAVGHHTDWSIAIVLVSLFFAFYLIRISYAFFVVGLTIMVSQLYVQLDEFSNSLLTLRLEETAIGAAAAAATVLLVLPLRTERVAGVALRAHVQALSALVDHAAGRLLERPGDTEDVLRGHARGLDASYQALVTTMAPMRRSLLGEVDEGVGETMALASASRHYGRNLVADVGGAHAMDPRTRAEVSKGLDTMRASLDALAEASGGSTKGRYVRSASLYDDAERRLESSGAQGIAGRLALRDLKLIDETMAQLAQSRRLEVTDLDTVSC